MKYATCLQILANTFRSRKSAMFFFPRKPVLSLARPNFLTGAIIETWSQASLLAPPSPPPPGLYQSFLGSPVHRLLFIHCCMCGESCPKSASTQVDSTRLNRLRRKQRSVTQRASKYVTVTLDTDEERMNVPCIQTYRWKKKLAVLMPPRFQGFLQSTKTLVLKPGK